MTKKQKTSKKKIDSAEKVSNTERTDVDNFSGDEFHTIEIKDPDNIHKCISISGLCVSCDKRRVCDFIKDFADFLKNIESTKRIVDCELSIFSCEDYPGKEKDEEEGSVYRNYPKKTEV